VSFPDFPGCITAGKTIEESRRNAQKALALHISGMIEDGQSIPRPSTFDEIAKEPAVKNAVTILVEPHINGKTQDPVWKVSLGHPSVFVNFSIGYLVLRGAGFFAGS
jgi:predicted RNase H-like HicB family nuclease